MTHKQKILEHMQKHQSITPLDAMRFGCMRLAARIHELKFEGYQIETRKEPHDGGTHARYVWG